MWQTSGDRDNKVFNGIQCMQYTCNMIYVYVHQCASYDLMYIYMIHVRIVYSKHHPILPFSPPPHFLARTISQTFITTLAFPLDMPCRFVSLHLTSTNGTTISSWWLYIFLFSLIMSLILFHFIWIFSRPSYADIIFFNFLSHTISTNSSWTFGVLDSAWCRQNNDEGSLDVGIWVGSWKHK